jgi:hypothetical protein
MSKIGRYLLLMILLAEVAEAQESFSLDVGKFRVCNSPETCHAIDCTPLIVCSDKRDDRDCSRCVKLFGKCITDAVCEAAKASQNALYSKAKGECELQKSQFKLQCETKKEGCKLEIRACEVLRTAEIRASQPLEIKLGELIASARQMQSNS